MKITLKRNAVVVLIGAMGTSKSSFCNKHFNHYDVVATDDIRYQLTGNFEYQYQNKAVFKILYATIDARLKANIFTMVDSTGSRSVLENVKEMAKKHKRDLIAIKFPHLQEHELTPERMQHRMKCLDAYYRQVIRIDETIIPKEYNVYEIDDINNIEVEFEQSYREEVTLDDHYDYIVVPDLHGEHKIIEEYAKKYKDDHKVKFIFLGDIVDRGPSSYKTFLIVNSLIKSGKGYGVISNHDNKFYRYLKKWCLDEDVMFKYSTLDDGVLLTYGLKIANGLERTLHEFYKMAPEEMEEYAKDFIEYYEKLNVYLYLERKNNIYYFAHAGITRNIAMNGIINRGDKELVLYETLQDGHHVAKIFGNKKNDKGICVHIGHNHQYDEVKLLSNNDGYALVMNDIGLGKIKLKKIPKFVKI